MAGSGINMKLIDSYGLRFHISGHALKSYQTTIHLGSQHATNALCGIHDRNHVSKRGVKLRYRNAYRVQVLTQYLNSIGAHIPNSFIETFDLVWFEQLSVTGNGVI